MTTPHTQEGEPVRVQRKRTKGWKMPENTVYVGRPTKWGNPFLLKNFNNDRQRVVKEFGFMMNNYWSYKKDEYKNELRGKNLACWCPLNKPCHADVLLKIANSK